MTLPAPLEELPLLVSEGAVIPLLDPSVETLADYGAGAAVRLRDRARACGCSPGRAAGAPCRSAPARGCRAEETVTSEETAGGWKLGIQGNRTRRYEIEAALGSLRGGAFGPAASLPDAWPHTG